MKKLFLILGTLLLGGSVCVAQTTAVTATVVDSDTTVWAGASWTLSFVVGPTQSNPAAYTIGGAPLDPAISHQTGVADGSGVITFTTYRSTSISPVQSTWNLQVCPNASAPCAIYNFSTSVSTLNISTGVNSVIIAPRFRAISGSYGYIDAEAVQQLVPGSTYWNNTSSCQRYYNIGIWACGTGNIVSIPVPINEGGTNSTTSAAAAAAIVNNNPISPSSVTTGTVGIGTTTPAYPLDVVGNTHISGVVGIGVTPTVQAGLFLNNAANVGTSFGTVIRPVFGTSVNNAYTSSFEPYTAASAAITNQWGVHIANPSLGAGATIANNYGLYIDSQTSGGTANYAIYSAGGTNYFDGNVGIGTVTPAYPLDVVGAANADTINQSACLTATTITTPCVAYHHTNSESSPTGSLATVFTTTVAGTYCPSSNTQIDVASSTAYQINSEVSVPSIPWLATNTADIHSGQIFFGSGCVVLGAGVAVQTASLTNSGTNTGGSWKRTDIITRVH